MIAAPETFLKGMRDLQQKHDAGLFVRAMGHQSPVFKQLDAFTKALNVFVQADGTGAASLVSFP